MALLYDTHPRLLVDLNDVLPGSHNTFVPDIDDWLLTSVGLSQSNDANNAFPDLDDIAECRPQSVLQHFWQSDRQDSTTSTNDPKPPPTVTSESTASDTVNPSDNTPSKFKMITAEFSGSRLSLASMIPGGPTLDSISESDATLFSMFPMLGSGGVMFDDAINSHQVDGAIDSMQPISEDDVVTTDHTLVESIEATPATQLPLAPTASSAGPTIESSPTSEAKTVSADDSKRLECMHCGKRFKRVGHRREHERTHTGEKPYACSFCGKRFSRNSHVLTHERGHTGEKPFACRYCNKHFGQRGDVVTHERIHTNEKPYSCGECGKRFSQLSHRDRHERIHTGEKPYSCRYCKVKFSQHSHRTSHERIHTGEKPYQCRYCGKRCSRIGNLTIHEKIHTESATHECNVCKKKFSTKSSLKKHSQLHTKVASVSNTIGNSPPQLKLEQDQYPSIQVPM